jgi:hypothetical protein
MSNPANRVHEINETDLIPTDQPRQRSARNDPVMRDGDNSHGSPAMEDGPTMTTTDNDVGDTAAVAASEEAGVLNAVPGKADGGHADPTLEAGPDPDVGTAADVPSRQVQASSDPTAGADDGLPRGSANRPDFGSADRHRHSSASGEPNARDGGLPMDDYKQLTVPQIMQRIEAMSHEERRAVQRYEESHRRRKTLLVRLERLLRAARHDARTRPDGANEPSHGRSMHSN